MNKAPVIGIDFGTSNCCIGAFINGNVEIIPNDFGEKFTPSYITFTENDILIGNSSKNQMTRYPSTTIYNIKQLIGRKFEDIEVQKNIKYYPFKLIKNETNDLIKIEIEIKGVKKEFSIEEILAMIFKKLKQLATNYLNKEVKDVIIAIPSYFNDLQRQIIKDSTKISGLNLLKFYGDTICSSVCFGFNKNFQSEHIVIFFNLGSGTLSISIIIIEEGLHEVKAVNGNINLGGNDFDNRLIEFCAEEFKSKYSIDFKQNKKALLRVKIACEKAKILLSSANEAIIEVEHLIDDYDLYIKITRTKFEDLCIDLFKECFLPLENILIDAKMSKSDINEIILLGGSTHIPKIISLIQEFFDGKKPNKFINNKESFANGASILGAVVTNVKNDYLEKIIVLDVIPFSLGIEGENGEMECIIPRNSTIPTKRTIIFSTFKNNVIKVYEGENKLAKDNNLLNEFNFDEIEPMTKNKEAIKITFDLDVNFVLNVSVEKSNEKYNNYLIENKIKLSQNEIDKSREKIEKIEKNEENEENELENRNEIFFLEKEIERLKEENRILKDKNENNMKIIEEEKITNNNYKNKIKILNNKLDDLIQKLNNNHQEQAKLKSELNELKFKYENNKNIIEKKIKKKNQEFNEIKKNLSKLMKQKRKLEDEYN